MTPTAPRQIPRSRRPLAPDLDATMHEVMRLSARGAHIQAIALLEVLVGYAPEHPEARHALGALLMRSGQLDRARQHLETARALRPDSPEFLNSCGVLAERSGRPHEAVRLFRAANLEGPDYAVAHHNLGNVLKDLGRMQEAVEAYDGALRANPAHADARFNRATALLALGRYDEGLPEYEARWALLTAADSPAAPTASATPLWDGGPLEGRTVLIQSEQGLGDSVQFIRYARFVRERGGRPIAAVQPALIHLLNRADALEGAVPSGDAVPEHDVRIPMMSLPWVAQSRPARVPWDGPYLSPDPVLKRHWAERIAELPGPKIGLCWRASASYATHNHRRNRAPKSMTLGELTPLFERQATWFPLQEELTATEASLRQAGYLESLGPDFDKKNGAFMDTAALVANLDLVVTVDTAVAHVAGALGVPTWLLLPFVPDWRWGLEGESTPWYPSMRLFRQRRPFDWDDVITRVASALGNDAHLSPIAHHTHQEIA